MKLDIISIDDKLAVIKYLKTMVDHMNECLVNNYKKPSTDKIHNEMDIMKKFISDFNNMSWGE